MIITHNFFLVIFKKLKIQIKKNFLDFIQNKMIFYSETKYLFLKFQRSIKSLYNISHEMAIVMFSSLHPRPEGRGFALGKIKPPIRYCITSPLCFKVFDRAVFHALSGKDLK